MAHREYINEDGESYPSVTTILNCKPKPWLETWKNKWGVWAERKTKAATAIGTAFHECVEKVIVWDKQTRRVINMYAAYNTWAEQVGLKVESQELHVVSEMYHYQGTFDAIGYLADKPRTLCLFDWKTGSSIYPDMALQMSAYAQAYFEQTGKRIKRGIIVHVSKDKPHHKITVKEYSLNKRLFNKFLKRLSEYREMTEGV